MTNFANVENHLSADKVFAADHPKTFEVDEAYWGYIVRAVGGSGFYMYLVQTITMFLGAAFLAAALGLLLMPATLMGGHIDLFRIFAVIMFVAIAAFLLWFASRGTKTELQIDTALGEVREVVRNRTGKTTLLGRYGFDAIGGVFIDRTTTGHSVLSLRYRNTAQTLQIAYGPEKDLLSLKDRVGHDLMIVGADR